MVWRRPTCTLVAGMLCAATVLGADTKEKAPVAPAASPQKLMAPATVGSRAINARVDAALTPNPVDDSKEGRQGGNDCASAVAIPGIPFSTVGSTVGFTDNYDEICPFNAPGAPDVVYSFTPAADVTVDITLCANSAYDTKLYVYQNVCGTYQSGTAIACNDDICSTPSYGSPYVSAISGLSLTAGNTYYIVVDGYGGDAGSYTFDMNEAAPPPDCPPDSLFSQPPSSPSDFWTAYTSEQNVQGSPFTVYDDYSVIGSITDIHWWGIEAAFDGFGFTPCIEPNPTFNISFHPNVGGLPGAATCSYTVVASRVDTGLLYAGFPLTYYTVDPLVPFCNQASGWVGIQGAGSTTCWFLWLSSGPGGGGSGLQDLSDGAGPQPIPDDLALCLTGAYEPLFGACCDDSTGVCEDNVELIDCIGPGLRFAADTLCEELSPGCGELPGACCYDDGTCEITTQATCIDTNGDWLGAFTSCDQCPIVCPPGGIQETEPCGQDTNGGCNSAPPAFQDIQCGDVICGTVWFDGSTRDTDWYRVVVTEETQLTWTVAVEFDALIGPVPTDPPGTGNCADVLGVVDPAAFPAAGTVGTTSVCVAPGTYFLFVAPQFADLVSCPAGYIATLTCEPCVVPRGACCLGDAEGTCIDDLTAAECGAMGGIYQGDGTECFPGLCPIPPDNNECDNAVCVNDGIPVNGTNIAATGTDISSCAFNDWRDVWYSYTPTISGPITAQTCGGITNFDTTLAVYNGCGGPEIVCNDDACGLQSSVTWNGTAGVEYLIRVAGYNGAEGDFTLLVTGGAGICDGEPEPGACCFADGSCADLLPADCQDQGGIFQGFNTECATTNCPVAGEGDNCLNPRTVTLGAGDLPYNDADTTCGRGNDYSDTCLGSYDGGEDFMYELILTEDMCIQISVVGSSWTGVAIDSACPPGPTCIAFGTSSAGTPSLQANLAAGTYYVMIDTWPSPNCTDFTMTISACPAPPENDECADAICVEDGVPVVGTNVNATGVDITSCTFNDWRDVWYSYTPKVSGPVTADTCTNPLFDTALAVFEGCDGAELACNDDFCGLQSSVTWNATAGVEYLIRVAGYNGAQGEFTLTVTGGQGGCICGDLDGDGDVDQDDYNLFVDAFGSCIGDPKYIPEADFDGDGCITLVDFQAWVQCYRDANPNQPLPVIKKGQMNSGPVGGGQPAREPAPGRP